MTVQCAACGATPDRFPERIYWQWPEGDDWAGEWACDTCFVKPRGVTPRTVDLSVVPWRVGRTVGRTIYAVPSGRPDESVLIGMLDTPELALAAVTAHNAALDINRG